MKHIEQGQVTNNPSLVNIDTNTAFKFINILGKVKDQITNILEKMSAGINPARKGTNIVARDQTNTPTSRTRLQAKEKSTISMTSGEAINLACSISRVFLEDLLHQL